MKKLLFSVLACVAFAGSNLASNGNNLDVRLLVSEIKTDVSKFENLSSSPQRPCSVYVRLVTPDGDIHTRRFQSRDDVSLSECESLRDKIISDLRESGYRFDDEAVYIVWG